MNGMSPGMSTLFNELINRKISVGGAEVRRLINSKAISVNGEVVTSSLGALYIGDVVKVGKHVEFTYGG